MNAAAMGLAVAAPAAAAPAAAAGAARGRRPTATATATSPTPKRRSTRWSSRTTPPSRTRRRRGAAVRRRGAGRPAGSRRLHARRAGGRVMRCSAHGVEFIAAYEGFVDHPYRDSGGVWTIGYGHTGPGVASMGTISRARGLELLAHDVGSAEHAVNALGLAFTQASSTRWCRSCSTAARARSSRRGRWARPCASAACGACRRRWRSTRHAGGRCWPAWSSGGRPRGRCSPTRGQRIGAAKERPCGGGHLAHGEGAQALPRARPAAPDRGAHAGPGAPARPARGPAHHAAQADLEASAAQAPGGRAGLGLPQPPAALPLAAGPHRLALHKSASARPGGSRAGPRARRRASPRDIVERRGHPLGFGSRHPRGRARSRRGAARGEPQPAEGDRRQGDGPRLAGRRAARRAVPLRRRRPRLPLARRPRAPPQRLPRRGRRPPAAAAGRDADVGVQGRAPGARAPPPRRASAHGPPLHRRRDAARGHRRARGPLAARRRDVASTCSARRRSPPPRPTATPRAAREALDGLAEVYRKPARAPGARGRQRRARSRARTCRSRSPPSRRCCAPTRPSSASATPRARLRELLRRARELDAHLHIDMESFDSREAVTDLVLELLSEDEFRDGPSAGLVLQAYLRDCPAAVRADHRLGAARRRAATRCSCASSRAPTGTTRSSRPASTAGQSPVFEVKADSDRNFEALTRRLLEARAGARPRRRSPATTCARSPTRRRQPRARRATTATSSSRSCAASATTSRTRWPRAGLRVRTYCPVGDLVAGMAYLVRRLLENTSNESFLHEQARGPLARRAARRAMTDLPTFVNEPIARAAPRDARATRCSTGMARARARAAAARPGAGSATASARRRRARLDRSRRPRPRRRRSAPRPPTADVDAAVEAAARGVRRAGRATPGRRARAESSSRAAAWMRERRAELAALAVRECAKPWAEADADVCEAIDFLEFYARGAVALDRGTAALPGPRRAQRDALRAARRRGGDRAVELPRSRSRWA